jgi:hypothetical protein
LSPSPATIALLAAAALGAGTVDAIAGGGGLVTIPALLAAGLPPQLALGTNKGQAVFGSGAALAGFARKGLVDRDRARTTFLLGFAGSLGGAALVLVLRPEVLRPVILGLLLLAAMVLAIRPRAALRETPPRPGAARAIAAAAALAIGAYDGFFGPGAGTFLILVFAALLATPLARASADAKVVNFASNLAAFVLFAARGTIVWPVALPMAACQLAGGVIGSHLAARGGDRAVRRVVIVVALALVAKLAADLRG